MATTLDKLQGEDMAFMGILLPQLHLMKYHLETLRDGGTLQHAMPLVQALLKAYDKRFANLYSDMRVLMATATHPHYTIDLLKTIAPDFLTAVKERIVTELMRNIGSEVEEQHNSLELMKSTEGSDDEMDLLMGSKTNSEEKQELGEELKNILNCWKRTNSKTALTKEIFSFQYREAWMTLFIKYNTPLPSSAAVERLFSVGGDILRSKRAALTAFNFEQLVFMKGNMDLLSYEDDMEDEDLHLNIDC
jgi:hypothetical protein